MSLAGKKILLIVGSVNQGGAEFQLLSLARLLQSRGLQVEVLALTDYTYFLPFIKEHNIQYSCVSNDGSSFQRMWRAVRQINNKKPDLAISYIKKVSQVAILARVLSGFRFKLIASERTSLIKKWHDLFYFNLVLLANKLTVNSVSKLAYINKRFPLLKKKTVFMPNIINVQRFAGINRENFAGGICNIAYAGRISPEKNLLNLVRAINEVVKKGRKVTLSLYGAGSNKKYLGEVLSLIKELQLDNAVRYKGPSNDIAEVYRNAHLLCLVSVFEGFSNVLSEAICSGIPVIASDIAENHFLIKENENGFLVNPADYKSIAGGIEKFLSLSPSAVNTISNNNKEKAASIFDEENIYRSYLSLFRDTGFSD